MLRPLTIIIGILAGSAPLIPAPALACSPIEALFGACRLEVFRPAYAYPSETRRPRPERKIHVDRARRAKAKAAIHNDSGVSGKRTPLQPTADAPVGSLALFRQDSTLRNGDIVVTADGFKVYRHGDFRPIAHDGGKLAQLEKASLKGRSRPEPARRQSLADRTR